MFTPQRKTWSGRPDVHLNPKNLGKGKGVVAMDSPPLGENGGGETEVWRRFRDAGLLDEASLEKKDKEAVVQRISKLELELYDYQYNMGLLLIEKKEWTSKIDELRQTLDEAEEIVKRERAAHLMALSELENREENLRKALGVEKRCVADLERALHDSQSDSVGVKVTSDEKLVEAQALVASIEEKSLEVEGKFRAADAKMAEASRKSTEVDRKLREVESREGVLRKERSSFGAEKTRHESAFLKQREDLREWEKNLQAGQQRLIDGQGLLNLREDRVNAKEGVLNQKERDLEDAQKNIEIASSALKDKAADISMRLAALATKEEEADVNKKNLEYKEQQLLALEEKLNVRERFEIQKLIDEQKAVLDSEKKEFELGMDQKRTSLEKELQSKVDAMERKEAEINQKEGRLVKKEQTLEKRTENLKEKEKDYDSKCRSLKEKEKFLKAEVKTLEMEKNRLETERQELLNLQAELANDRAAMEELEQRIHEEREKIKVTEDDKREHLLLQSELQAEIEELRIKKELIIKDREDLKQDRIKFERDWEVLDGRKDQIEQEQNYFKEEKDRFDKWREDEEERLRTENLAAKDEVKREWDALHEMKLVFEEERERERNHINLLREQTRREREEIRVERQKIDKEKQDITTSREQLMQDQLKIRNDVEELTICSKKVRDQGEQFIKEKSRFLAFFEQNKTCRCCGEILLTDFQPSSEIEDVGAALLPTLSKDYWKEKDKGRLPSSEVSPGGMDSSSGGRMSWLRKCTSKIFNISPVKGSDDTIKSLDKGSPLLVPQSNIELSERLNEADNEPESSFEAAVVSDSVDIDRIQSDYSFREKEGEPIPSADERSEVGRSLGVSEVFSVSPENAESRTPAAKYSLRRTSKQSKNLRATRSMKQVIEESKAIIGETSEKSNDKKMESGKPEEISLVNEESRGGSIREDSKISEVGQKRQLRTNTGEQNADESEARSESVTTGGRRKRRQTVAQVVENPGVRRYNLRKSTIAGSATPAPLSGETDKGAHLHSTQLPENSEVRESDIQDAEHTDVPSIGVAAEIDTNMNMLQQTFVRSTVEVHEGILSKTAVKLETCESLELSEEDGNQISGNGADGVEEAETGVTGYETDEADYEDGSENESEKRGTASIGKKLWSFFTT